MSTHLGPRSEQAPQAIIPVRPPGPETAHASSTPAGRLRRTLGGRIPSRRTLGRRLPPSRRALGYKMPSRRTLGRKLPPSRRALG
jgi:hypothetical protein